MTVIRFPIYYITLLNHYLSTFLQLTILIYCETMCHGMLTTALNSRWLPHLLTALKGHFK